MPTQDVRIADLARQQDSLVTRQQLLAVGITPRRIELLVRRQWLRPMGRGVYLVGAVPPEWCRERAVLFAHPRAVLSQWTAGRLTGLVPGVDGPDVVCIIVPAGSSGRAPGVRALRTDSLHATEWRPVRGLRATTPARTLLDLAPELGRAGDTRRLEQLVARALDEKLCTSDDIAAVLRRHARVRGAGLLRLVLGDDGRPSLSRSEAEERLRQHLAAAELPPWRQNVRVARYEVDFLWPEQRLVAEVDGFAWHSSRNRFEADRARDAALAAAGYVVLRFTWRRLDRAPMAVVARIAFVLGRRSGGRTD